MDLYVGIERLYPDTIGVDILGFVLALSMPEMRPVLYLRGEKKAHITFISRSLVSLPTGCIEVLLVLRYFLPSSLVPFWGSDLDSDGPYTCSKLV